MQEKEFHCSLSLEELEALFEIVTERSFKNVVGGLQEKPDESLLTTDQVCSTLQSKFLTRKRPELHQDLCMSYPLAWAVVLFGDGAWSCLWSNSYSPRYFFGIVQNMKGMWDGRSEQGRTNVQ